MKESRWKKLFDSLKRETAFRTDQKIIKKEFNELFSKAVLESYNNAKKPVGVLFSGGVDSTFIAWLLKKNNCDFVCISVGLPDSKDILAAEETSKQLNFRLIKKEFSHMDIENVLKEVVPLFRYDYVKISVGAVIYSALKIASQFGIKDVFTGLGSEELFAGYQRHENALIEAAAPQKKGLLRSSYKNKEDPAKDMVRLDKECWDGLKNIWSRDISRDIILAEKFKINLHTPFLEKEIIEYALSIDPRLRIFKNTKKYILREAALYSGIPEKFAFRKKSAAQYGSSFDRAIQKLAKKNKFKFKMDYLKTLE